MSSFPITTVRSRDARFPLAPGEGSDSVHSNPVYSYAVAEIAGDGPQVGIGLAFTLGGGNDLVCRAIEMLAEPLIGRDIEEVMAEHGSVQRALSDHPQLRWLGPHKGVVHLALAALTNGLFDLWAKSRGVPLWRLLLDLSPSEVVALLDMHYLEDVLSAKEAVAMLEAARPGRADREWILKSGYPGYDTSVGWFQFSDDEIRERTKRAVGQGFTALKLKVGSREGDRDLRRAAIVREAAGPDVRLMVDANQAWTLPEALRMSLALAPIEPYWIEEPTHPDDVLAHQTLARAIAPIPIALGEHVPNRVLFKNFIQAGAMRYVQADCVRLAGVSEFLVVSLLARKHGLPVVPHVGDMGQIHQHLVLFNRVALGDEIVFLEQIPHLCRHFVHPATVSGGVYAVPQEPGSSSDLV